MNDSSKKIINFPKKDSTPNYYEPSRVLIFMNRPPNIEALRKKDLRESGELLTSFGHEIFHHCLTFATSFGIYEILLRAAFFIQTSATAFRETRHKDTQLSLPFIEDIKYFPELKRYYDFLIKYKQYIYQKPEIRITDEYGIRNLARIKIKDELYDYTDQKSSLLLPTFILRFKINGKVENQYLPFDANLIQENFCRIVHDDLLRKVQSKGEYSRDLGFRMKNGLFLPYYILSHFTVLEFHNANLDPFSALILASYISMMFLKPISCQPERDHYWGLNLDNDNDIEFISSLKHPGETFRCALDALKKVGKSIKESDLIEILNAACEEMKIPSVKEMNLNMRTFLYRIQGSYISVNERYPFLNRFVEDSLEILKKTEDEGDLRSFLLRPDLNLKHLPVIISDDRFINHGSPENQIFDELSSIIEQFLYSKRIFCSDKKNFGSKPSCANDKECSVDKEDFPYSKCETGFLGFLKYMMGDVNRLVPS